MILNSLAPEKRIILGSSLSRDHRNYGVAQLLREVFLFARSLFLLSFSPYPFILPFLSLSFSVLLALYSIRKIHGYIGTNRQTMQSRRRYPIIITVTTVEMRLGGWIGSKLKTRSLPLTSTCSTYFALVIMPRSSYFLYTCACILYNAYLFSLCGKWRVLTLNFNFISI